MPKPALRDRRWCATSASRKAGPTLASAPRRWPAALTNHGSPTRGYRFHPPGAQPADSTADDQIPAASAQMLQGPLMNSRETLRCCLFVKWKLNHNFTTTAMRFGVGAWIIIMRLARAFDRLPAGRGDE